MSQSYESFSVGRIGRGAAVGHGVHRTRHSSGAESDEEQEAFAAEDPPETTSHGAFTVGNVGAGAAVGHGASAGGARRAPARRGTGGHTSFSARSAGAGSPSGETRQVPARRGPGDTYWEGGNAQDGYGEFHAGDVGPGEAVGDGARVEGAAAPI